MKRSLLLMLLLIGIGAGNVKAVAPKIFISYESKSELSEAKNVLGLCEQFIIIAISKKFPCASIKDEWEVKQNLEWERIRQVFNPEGESRLENIASALNCDYLIHFTVNVVGNKFYIDEFFADFKKAKVLARASSKGTISEVTDKINQISKDLIKQMEEYEICPYLGPLNIEVKSNRDEENTSTSPAPCDGGTLTTTLTIKSNSTLSWKFNKVARRVTTGEVNYDLTEDYKTVRSYSCYECKDGLETAMTFTDTRNSETNVEGLSNESVSEGKKIDDARIQIVFKDDGTYLVLVKATSKKGDLKETTETKTQGACEVESKPPVTKNKSIDIPITAVFGRYQGSAEDKVLSQKETKDVSQGKETTTVSIDFNLVKN